MVSIFKCLSLANIRMTRNVEIKARTPDLAALHKRVAEISDSGPELLVQRDTFYAAARGRLKLREFGDGTAELIYYERPDKIGPKTSRYTRTEIADPASMRELLGQILAIKAVVSKRREVFMVDRTRIHLDEVDDLGTFIELEVVLTESQMDSDGERIASDLMDRLGVRREDLIEQAYVDLLAVIPNRRSCCLE
jgi:predicted adenylyl cyclase CyaB